MRAKQLIISRNQLARWNNESMITFCTSGLWRENSSKIFGAGTTIGHSNRPSISRRSSYSRPRIRRNSDGNTIVYIRSPAAALLFISSIKVGVRLSTTNSSSSFWPNFRAHSTNSLSRGDFFSKIFKTAFFYVFLSLTCP